MLCLLDGIQLKSALLSPPNFGSGYQLLLWARSGRSLWHQRATFYNQARAKYAKCQYFTESVPADSVPGSGTLETTTQTMSKASVSNYHAFQVGQISDLTDQAGVTIQQSTLVTVEGTDVFTINSVGGTNDPVPASLMLKLINRVKKLR